MFERSMILLGSYALEAATSILCLVVFLSLKREIQNLRVRIARQDLAGRLDAMNERIHSAEERSNTLSLPQISQKRSLNVSKRSQVIRLSRRGEPVETIAATLGLPRREVELLIKVHQMTAAAAPTS